MLNSSSTGRLIGLQLATLGFYFFYWCSTSRREVNKVLGKPVIPTTWFLALPAGNYWWMWHYSQALERVTRRAIKASDTFLYYILASLGWMAFDPLFRISSNASSSDIHLTASKVLLLIAVAFTVIYLLIMAGNTFFICLMQRKIDTARGVSSH